MLQATGIATWQALLKVDLCTPLTCRTFASREAACCDSCRSRSSIIVRLEMSGNHREETFRSIARCVQCLQAPKAVLAGDHRQLPPTILSEVATEMVTPYPPPLCKMKKTPLTGGCAGAESLFHSRASI